MLRYTLMSWVPINFFLLVIALESIIPIFSWSAQQQPFHYCLSLFWGIIGHKLVAFAWDFSYTCMWWLLEACLPTWLRDYFEKHNLSWGCSWVVKYLPGMYKTPCWVLRSTRKQDAASLKNIICVITFWIKDINRRRK
jgi:hypothetical protein